MFVHVTPAAAVARSYPEDVELVIASIGFAAGVQDLTLFSVAVAIGFITSVLAPITARPFVSRAKSRGSSDVAVIEQESLFGEERDKQL